VCVAAARGKARLDGAGRMLGGRGGPVALWGHHTSIIPIYALHAEQHTLTGVAAPDESSSMLQLMIDYVAKVPPSSQSPAMVPAVGRRNTTGRKSSRRLQT